MSEQFGPDTVLTVDGAVVPPLAGHHEFAVLETDSTGITGDERNFVPLGVDLSRPTDFLLEVENLGNIDSHPEVRQDVHSNRYYSSGGSSYGLSANYLLLTLNNYPTSQFLAGTIQIKRAAL